jgi:RNA polymerase sigma factor (sigma-70 family)
VTPVAAFYREDPNPQPAFSDGDCEEMLLNSLPLIRAIAKRMAKSQHMPASQIEDFVGDVLVRLIDRDYAVLKQLRQPSSLATFLKVVIRRICLDMRIAQWGKWRPSVHSLRAGPVVILLERLTMRDGLSFDDACAILRAKPLPRFDSNSLAAHHRRFVRRHRIRFVGADAMSEEPPASSSAEELVIEAEANRTLDDAVAVLADAFALLPQEDRALLTLHFRDGLSVTAIARDLHLDQKCLHSRYSSVLKRLRRTLVARRVSGADILEAIGGRCQHTVSVFRNADLEFPYAKAS